MTDPTSETTPKWVDLFGIDPDFTGSQAGRDLAEFLLARIAEDEAAAQAVGRTRYYLTEFPRRGIVATGAGEILAEVGERAPFAAGALFDHNARHQPGRVMAECEAKRRIIAAHGRDELDAFTGSWEVRVMGAVYADHPDYRDEWRP